MAEALRQQLYNTIQPEQRQGGGVILNKPQLQLLDQIKKHTDIASEQLAKVGLDAAVVQDIQAQRRAPNINVLQEQAKRLVCECSDAYLDEVTQNAPPLVPKIVSALKSSCPQPIS